MSHHHHDTHHHHGHHHHHHGDPTGNITVAFWINLAFALVELAGGWYTNSVAILSDALHDFGDSMSLGLAWYFQRKSKQGRDHIYSYGYKRFSLLGALATAMILTMGSVFVIREAVVRLWNPEQPDARGMIVLALLGVAANLVAMLRLRKGSSLTEKAVALHFLEDVLGWGAVLLGSVVMLFIDVPVLDPILSIAIAAFILFNVYKNIRAAMRIILQGMPEHLQEASLQKHVLAVAGVKSVHDLHTWTLDGVYHVLTLHVVTRGTLTIAESEQLKAEIRHTLLHQDIQHVTIELESEDHPCTQPPC